MLHFFVFFFTISSPVSNLAHKPENNSCFVFHSSGVNATIEYILKVYSIFPEFGSLLGGTSLTVSGSGFSNNVSDNKVTFGKRREARQAHGDKLVKREPTQHQTNDWKSLNKAASWCYSDFPKRADLKTYSHNAPASGFAHDLTCWLLVPDRRRRV